MSKIKKVVARQVYDSRGNPTIEAEVFSNNLSASAICPSGASTGTFEAYEKRDKSNKKYLGKSVLIPVATVNKLISKKLKNQNIHDQERIDSILIKLDGTKQKTKLGANTILAVSMAVKKLSAKVKKIPLYKNFIVKKNFKLPFPLMNIINGGAHADNGLRIQEFMIRPDKAKSFNDAVRMCFLVINNLKVLLKKAGHSINVGDEGGFAPNINSLEEALSYISESVENSGYKLGEEIFISIDAAASEFYEKDIYTLKGENKTYSSDELVTFWENICNKFPIVSIEDPFDENDWNGFKELTKRIGKKVQIVGDDLFVTNKKRLLKGIKNSSANSILIKLNQIGTLSETLETMELAKDANFGVIVSHRSGETEDVFISDLCVALNAGQIKTGSLSRSDRTAKYNQLLRIEEMLGEDAYYFGNNFFKNFNI